MANAQRVDPRPCEHLSLKLEQDDSGFFTSNYQCIACGESVVKKLEPRSIPASACINDRSNERA